MFFIYGYFHIFCKDLWNANKYQYQYDCFLGSSNHNQIAKLDHTNSVAVNTLHFKYGARF